MDEKENIVLYDWLSFTSKKHSPEELIEALGLTHCPWQEIKGAHGYRDRKYFNSTLPAGSAPAAAAQRVTRRGVSNG